MLDSPLAVSAAADPAIATMPSYEIVIPAYNARSTIGETIASLLAQTYPPARIIVADDGSSDDTERAVREYPSISYVRFEHTGISGVQNRALRLVDSGLVALVDSDDLWHPDTGRVLVECLKDDQFVAASVRPSPFLRGPWAGAVQPVPTDLHWKEVTLPEMLRENLLAKSGTMIAVAPVRAVGGYSESLTSCEDLDLWLRLMESGGRIVRTQWQGLGWRMRPGTMSRQPTMLVNLLTVVMPRVMADPELTSRDARRLARRAWLQTLARAANDRRDLHEVPRLSDVVDVLAEDVPVGSMTKLGERVVASRLAGSAAAGWRCYRSVRGVVRSAVGRTGRD